MVEEPVKEQELGQEEEEDMTVEDTEPVEEVVLEDEEDLAEAVGLSSRCLLIMTPAIPHPLQPIHYSVLLQDGSGRFPGPASELC